MVNPDNYDQNSQEVSDVPPKSATFALSALFLLRESLQILIPALLLATLIHIFLAQATVVYGQSMEPNLHERQRLIIDKLSYRLHEPQRNDIVVLTTSQMNEKLVKRVVGMPGETVAIYDGTVYINKKPLLESFPHDLSIQHYDPIALPPDHFFVLGDNRSNSNDSRAFGPVHRSSIVGRVWLRYWPLREFEKF